MAQHPETSPNNREAHAALLTLRFVDHWMTLGTEMLDPTSRALGVTRAAVDSPQVEAEMRSSLLTILDGVVALHDSDAQPVLPRVYALAMLFEQRGLLAQAADVYRTVARYVDASAHLDLAYDAHMRHGYCLRYLGEFEWADQAYASAGTLATRDGDRIRVVLARLGRAKVIWDRGDLPVAAEAIRELLVEAESLDSMTVRALLLHDRGVLEWVRGNRENAIRSVFSAFQLSPDEYDRERMLGDLAAYLSQSGAHESARDALRVLERSARTQGGRWIAQINLMDLAYRTRNEIAFQQYRRALADVPLPPATRVSFLLDVGKGCIAFGQCREARVALKECVRLASEHAFNRRLIQAEETLLELDQVEQQRTPIPWSTADQSTSVSAPDDIQAALRQLLESIEEASARSV